MATDPDIVVSEPGIKAQVFQVSVCCPSSATDGPGVRLIWVAAGSRHYQECGQLPATTITFHLIFHLNTL